MPRIIFSFIVGFLAACSSGLTVVTLETDPVEGPRLYVSGMKGAENLAFDGLGSLFVTDLHGHVYKVVPANRGEGKITARKKLGKMCLGIEAGPDRMLYVGVKEESGKRRIWRLSRDFSSAAPVSGDIPGLNGLEMDPGGRLYYTSSNESVLCPRGRVYRVRSADEASFANPEVVVEKAGMVNGLALSSDGRTLYYTETLKGVWAASLNGREILPVYSPGGCLPVIDDIDTAADGTLWLCLNSERAVVPIRQRQAGPAFRIAGMGAPSSCRFGRGPGFSKDTLYVTEFGLKGRSFDMNGRGVWALPMKHLARSWPPKK